MKTDGVIAKIIVPKLTSKIKELVFWQNCHKTLLPQGRVYQSSHQKRSQKAEVALYRTTCQRTFTNEVRAKLSRGNNA